MEETRYETAELAKHAGKLFETTPEMVTVALRTAGLESATVEEARETVRAFLAKEVK